MGGGNSDMYMLNSVVKGRHLVERQFEIEGVWICSLYMLCRL